MIAQADTSPIADIVAEMLMQLIFRCSTIIFIKLFGFLEKLRGKKFREN